MCTCLKKTDFLSCAQDKSLHPPPPSCLNYHCGTQNAARSFSFRLAEVPVRESPTSSWVFGVCVAGGAGPMLLWFLARSALRWVRAATACASQLAWERALWPQASGSSPQRLRWRLRFGGRPCVKIATFLRGCRKAFSKCCGLSSLCRSHASGTEESAPPERKSSGRESQQSQDPGLRSF